MGKERRIWGGKARIGERMVGIGGKIGENWGEKEEFGERK